MMETMTQAVEYTYRLGSPHAWRPLHNQIAFECIVKKCCALFAGLCCLWFPDRLTSCLTAGGFRWWWLCELGIGGRVFACWLGGFSYDLCVASLRLDPLIWWLACLVGAGVMDARCDVARVVCRCWLLVSWFVLAKCFSTYSLLHCHLFGSSQPGCPRWWAPGRPRRID